MPVNVAAVNGDDRQLWRDQNLHAQLSMQPVSVYLHWIKSQHIDAESALTKDLMLSKTLLHACN